MNPTVSIIIPIYKTEKYLSRCLDSVLNQGHSDFEIICVNDGSPDNAAQILEEYVKSDRRIKLITQENQGLSVARNMGLKLAQGDYIYFLDADDAMHPQLLEICFSFAKKHELDLLEFDFERSDGLAYAPKKFCISEMKYKITDNPSFLGTKGKHCIAFNVWTKFYKKELLKGIDFIPGIHFEDYPHTYAVLAKKPRTLVLFHSLLFYTYNKDSISHQKINPQQILDYHIGINFIYDIYQNSDLIKEYKFLKRNLMPNILKQQLNKCKRADADIQPLMYQAFAEELRDLNQKGLISWRGHKLSRYFTYKKLIAKGAVR